ncbi:hypothetical protein Desmer_1306 [Desulfosporosinus meridiei DSM 13257]|uniref:Uncharacterized protein n=1 Tax=Desulfosporosinus meridiei (strain ATCC BAA-275 / DSM 13257 / KCTC 12902 / NCIMB 13706 / S10) TaxID=768704 RepID=J7INE5_DESMD|nr:hypothetical protein Desmer_1306 [Desulfosporosinus meridiei DSM 13257]
MACYYDWSTTVILRQINAGLFNIENSGSFVRLFFELERRIFQIHIEFVYYRMNLLYCYTNSLCFVTR